MFVDVTPRKPIDLKLVVTDLDGTLLDDSGRVPERFWEVSERLFNRGITLALASGRQHPALRAMFGPTADGMVFISGNGSHVEHGGREVSGNALPRAVAEDVVRASRRLPGGRDRSMVWCCANTAYTDSTNEWFIDHAEPILGALEVVDDLLEVSAEPLRLCVFDKGRSARTAPELQRVCLPHQVVMTTADWCDVMKAGVNKGAAVHALQRDLGIAPEQTVVFGDYLNDLEMISGAPHSFAMANAHPRIIEAARYVAPTNADHGVLTVLDELLEASDRAA